MPNHANRNRVVIIPVTDNLGAIRKSAMQDSLTPHPLWNYRGLVQDGCLIQHSQTSLYAIWRGDRLISVDQRKAKAAHDAIHA